jgi:chromatin structure-remodeling complex protein RSC7
MDTDGRWVTDDYYESKVLEDITAKGLQTGDLVGDLPDPNAPSHTHTTELSSLLGTLDRSLGPTGALAGGGAATGGGGGGVYRAGGPTTLFGGNGWGPYSDGPLNAVRKSVLSRDGVTEENWMWMMALRVNEMNEEWTVKRKESLKNIDAGLAMVGIAGRTMGGGLAPPSERALNPTVNEPGLGVYEPHMHSIFCQSSVSSFVTSTSQIYRPCGHPT